MVKKYIETNVKSTFEVANEIATGLHFSIAKYGVFTLGIIKLIPGTEKFADYGQQKIGQFAFTIGRKEN